MQQVEPVTSNQKIKIKGKPRIKTVDHKVWTES